MRQSCRGLALANYCRSFRSFKKFKSNSGRGVRSVTRNSLSKPDLTLLIQGLPKPRVHAVLTTVVKKNEVDTRCFLANLRHSGYVLFDGVMRN